MYIYVCVYVYMYWRRKWQPTPVFLPGKFHGQRSLVGYSPWSCKVRHDLATKQKMYICVCMKAKVLFTQSCSILSFHGLWPARLLCPWNSSARILEWVFQSLLQGIVPTQGSNPGLLHCRWILYCLSHQGSPRILEWLAPSPGKLPSPGIELEWLPM